MVKMSIAKAFELFRQATNRDYYLGSLKINFNKKSSRFSFNFWIHSVIIKLLPCLVLTVISFILIRVLCQAAKRKVKLKGYSQATSATNVNAALNGHR